MIDEKICEWLMDHADAPIRYRVARELLGDRQAVKNIEEGLTGHPAIALWLKNLKPESPPQRRSMEHGSFDFCFENAMLKAVQLGLHAGLPRLADAIGYYMEKMESAVIQEPVRSRDIHAGFDRIIISNLSMLAGVNNDKIRAFMFDSLDELYRFTQKGECDIYHSEEEAADFKGVPKLWRGRKFISRGLLKEYGFCYPLIYDIVGLHTLYGLNDRAAADKVNAVIGFISTDVFHDTVADGYGILSLDGKKYHSMGWDPKYPGWYDAEEYLKSRHAPALLFFAQFIAKYPTARKTKWYGDLTRCLEKYRTDSGTYLFPPEWLKEKQGYAVTGSHLSFGENKKKKNRLEIESTFYMQLLRQNKAVNGCP